MNSQLPEHATQGCGTVLDVHSVFQTIQGEGPLTGWPAVFLRLAGCNLQCPLCDTQYTKRTAYRTDDLAKELAMRAAPNGLVVITGGEPFRQNLGRLVSALSDYGLLIQIETNGTLPIQDEMLFYDSRVRIVCSPKGSRVHESLYPYLVAYRYVVRYGAVADDGLPLNGVLGMALHGHVARPHKGFTGFIHVSPADEANPVANEANLEQAKIVAKRHGYILNVQLHKLINEP